MKKIFNALALLMATAFIWGCSKNIPEKEKAGFLEAVPDTIRFINAEFIYNGDDIGDAFSDGWLIKLYTDMDINESGAPTGPGCVMQLLLNARYDEDQAGNPSILRGRYSEMMNSMNFAPFTFVSGHMTSISLPGGEKLELADENVISVVISPLEDGKTKSTYAVMGMNAAMEGMEIDIERAWHNDDYYFVYEDPVRYYSQYRKLNSGTLYIKRTGDSIDVSADLILPDGTDFQFEYSGTVSATL